MNRFAAYRFEIIWMPVTLAAFALVPVLSDYVWIFSILVPLACLIVAGCILFYRLAISFTRQDPTGDSRTAVLFGAIVVVILLALPVTRTAAHVKESVRFMLRRGDFDAIVLAESAQGATSESPAFTEYRVDAGPPLRIAFPSPGGLIDNWCGVLYDPSHDVMKVNGSEWRDPAVKPIRQLFGGDLVSCRHLDAHYFYCCFTVSHRPAASLTGGRGADRALLGCCGRARPPAWQTIATAYRPSPSWAKERAP